MFSVLILTHHQAFIYIYVVLKCTFHIVLIKVKLYLFGKGGRQVGGYDLIIKQLDSTFTTPPGSPLLVNAKKINHRLTCHNITKLQDPGTTPTFIDLGILDMKL